jgi:AMMECR1 domain-containing protein
MFGRVKSRGAGGGDLEARVAALEAAVQENRALNVRLAELTDVVTELLLPVAARDEERLEEILAKYRGDFS